MTLPLTPAGQARSAEHRLADLIEELSARFSHLEQIAKSKLPAVHYIDLRPSQAYHDESEEV